MAIQTFLKDELLVTVGISERQLDEIEAAGLLQPAAKTEQGQAVYDETNLEALKAVKGLLELGYGLPEVKKIRRKVGMPASRFGKGRAQGKLLTVGELAKRAGLNPRTIKYWEELEILTPEAFSAGGFRLYTADYVLFCQLIRDLQLFGYSLKEIKEVADLFREYDQIAHVQDGAPTLEQATRLEEMLMRIESLQERMRTLREGIRRWEGFTNTYGKRISRLKGQIARQLRSMPTGGDGFGPPAKDQEEELA